MQNSCSIFWGAGADSHVLYHAGVPISLEGAMKSCSHSSADASQTCSAMGHPRNGRELVQLPDEEGECDCTEVPLL